MYEKKNGNESKELHKNIGNRLLIKRRELHYTQEQMAELLGVSAGFYGMIERGEKAPSLEKLIIIYEKLGTDITYLLTGNKSETSEINIIEQCPRDKKYDLEQLIKYALNLAGIRHSGEVKIPEDKIEE